MCGGKKGGRTSRDTAPLRERPHCRRGASLRHPCRRNLNLESSDEKRGERTVCLPYVRVGEHLEELLVELVRERRRAAHDEADVRAQVVVLHCRVLMSLLI